MNQANALYAQIHDHKDDIFELEKIKEQAKTLIDRETARARQVENYQRERIEQANRLVAEKNRQQIEKEGKIIAKMWLTLILLIVIALALALITSAIDSILQ